MKRLIFLFAVLAALICFGACEKKDIGRTGLVKLGSHTWAMIASGPTSIEGLGANSGFVVGDRGILVVDSRYTPALAKEFLEKIRSISKAPVLYLVNTHYHPDHSWGNWVFAMQGARILAPEETREAFIRYSPIYFDFYRQRGGESFDVIKDVQFVPPDSILEENTRLDLGGVSVDLLNLGPAHTAADLVIFVPKDKVVFTGGLLSNGYHPNLGDPEADFEHWIEVLNELGRMRARYYVPGAGLVSRRDAIEKQKRYIEQIKKICTDAIRKRYPLQEVVRTISLPEAEGWLQPNLLPFNIQAIYRKEIPKIVNPKFALDLPEEFLITDGGGNPNTGYIRWSALSKEDGYRETEVQWVKSPRKELLVADLKDALARYQQLGKRAMKIEGTGRIDIPAGQAITASGTWSESGQQTGTASGLWSWLMIWLDGRTYIVQCAAENTEDKETAKRNISLLNKIAATIRPKD